MLKLLADENISPQTVKFLDKNGYDIISVRDVGLKGVQDERIVEFAGKESRTIVTFDLDFGEIYYFSAKEPTMILVLRLKSQWYETVNRFLLTLLQSKKLESEEYENALIIASEQRIRIRKKDS